MKRITWLSLGLLVVGLAAGCQKEEGTLEKAGKEADKALQDAGKAAGDAVDKAKEATK